MIWKKTSCWTFWSLFHLSTTNIKDSVTQSNIINLRYVYHQGISRYDIDLGSHINSLPPGYQQVWYWPRITYHSISKYDIDLGSHILIPPWHQQVWYWLRITYINTACLSQISSIYVTYLTFVIDLWPWPEMSRWKITRASAGMILT